MAIQSTKSSSTNKTVKKKSTVVKKKRAGIFDAIASLETQDDHATKRQHQSSAKDLRQTKAAQSQVQIYQRLMEVRILLQRVMSQQQSNDTSIDTTQQELCQQLVTQLVAARSTLTAGKSHESLKEEWKTVLNRRYKDLRLHAGLTAKAQFKLLDSDFYHQVEATTQYQLSNQATTADNKFDDSKLYQHQLQDFLSMDKKSDVVALSKKQKKKQNKKNNVDRKASKGRKIRYHVHPKIVNFTFPLQRPETTTMDEDEWFKSLFGGGKA